MKKPPSFDGRSFRVYLLNAQGQPVIEGATDTDSLVCGRSAIAGSQWHRALV